MNHAEFANVEFIMGNSNKRFSGVTSTMLQVLPHVNKLGKTAVLGSYHLSRDACSISFLDAIRLLRLPMPDGRKRLFHARRNDEMIQAILLKYVFRAKIKIVFTSTAQRKKTWLTRWLMKQMDGLISTCQAAADYMPTPPDRIIPHGIDVDAFSNQDISSIPYPMPGSLNVGLFGRVRSQKGVDLLIDASLELLPKYPQLGIVIVGEVTPEQQAFVKEQESKLIDSNLLNRVLFTGELQFYQVPKYFQAVDIVCALSINEGFGLTVLEGAASGKPIVATKAGAWPDILARADIGFLIEVGDKPALVSALESLIEDAEHREQKGKNAFSLVNRDFTVAREAEQLVDFYRSILDS